MYSRMYYSQLQEVRQGIYTTPVKTASTSALTRIGGATLYSIYASHYANSVLCELKAIKQHCSER
jgi:hypothetical protein